MKKLMFALTVSLAAAGCLTSEEDEADPAARVCLDCPEEPPPEGGGGGGGGGGGEQVLETMVDRCAGDVYLSWGYGSTLTPATYGVALRRPNSVDWTEWSEPMPVHGTDYLRWWCSSSIGSWLPAGTWRVSDAVGGRGCAAWPFASYACAGQTPFVLAEFPASGWSAERSRCASNLAGHVRARVGPDRRLEIRCLL